MRLHDLLAHLTVLILVLDDEKHYWVGDDEVEKLLRRGGGWLASHPERRLIAERYLKHKRHLAGEALARLTEEAPEADDAAEAHDREEAAVERPLSLNEQRLGAVLATLRASRARRVLDLGCREGRLMQALLKEPAFEQITGMDVSHRSLAVARGRLRLERLSEKQQARVSLLHGSLTYRDARLMGYDAAAVVEVVEHLDPVRLATFERVLFESIGPGTVVLTTPNVEYNIRFENLPAGGLRHRDHRFERTQAQFRAWAEGVGERFGYGMRFLPVGPEDAEVGPPTQMAVFSRTGVEPRADAAEVEPVRSRQEADDDDND